MERCPALGASIACSMHTKLAALHGSIEVLSAGTVESRLATALLKLYDQLGDDFEDGTSGIPVALSRRELAELVSTSLETAIRVMTRWERQGVLETTGEGFTIVDRSALERATGRFLEEG
jgi:CRP/FNR family transcriptional regulator